MNTIHQLILGLQEKFDEIRNVPEEDIIRLHELKEIQISWKNQADKIREKYNTEQVTAAGTGAVGIAAGIAVAALTPTVAMGVATTFGVASTGTAISALSGAAATNAALAWLRRWSTWQHGRWRNDSRYSTFRTCRSCWMDYCRSSNYWRGIFYYKRYV